MDAADVTGPTVAEPRTPRSCPLCGRADTSLVADRVRDYEYAAPGEYRWVCCIGCSLVRLDPFPSAAVLDQAYPNSYHAYVTPESAITRWFLARSRASLARSMAVALPAGATVLDIGCSSGLLLAEIGKLGRFRLLGVEYKREAAATARARGIEVWCGELADAPFSLQSVDLVILQHVLEHVFDPMTVLRTIAALLRPGGRLRGELPNLDSWDFRLFKRTWGGGHAPRHLWHFSPDTLKPCLLAAGFGTVAIRPALHTGHWALSIQNWLRRARPNTDGLRSGRAWYFPPLLLATLPVNLVQMVLNKTGVMRFEAVRVSP